MTDTRITIRGLDPELYKRLRVVAVREGIPAGKLLNLAIVQFLKEKSSPASPPARRGGGG